MKDNMTNFVKGFGQIAVSLIISVIFICIAKFVLRGYFIDNAYPVIMEYEDWSNFFVTIFTIASIVCIVLNILFVFLAAFVKGPFVNGAGWAFEFILSIIIGVVFAVVFSTIAPEDTFCLTIAEVMFVIEYVLAFFISSFFGDKFHKFQYNPILSIFNKNR